MKLTQLTSDNVTLADKAYQAIKDAIVNLELEPGQIIYEKEIADLLKVSRTPIREAFAKLKSEHMVEIFPQRCIRVALISEKKIKEASFVRKSLEISCFKEVAKEWDPKSEKCKQLHVCVSQALKLQKESIKNNDYFSFLKSDEKFHYYILNFINNEILMGIISQMGDHLNRVRYLELQEPKHMVNVMHQHNNIFKAIRENNEEKVANLLTEHFHKFEFNRELIDKYRDYFTS